jgi:hypothetical protein
MIFLKSMLSLAMTVPHKDWEVNIQRYGVLSSMHDVTENEEETLLLNYLLNIVTQIRICPTL